MACGARSPPAGMSAAGKTATVMSGNGPNATCRNVRYAAAFGPERAHLGHREI